MTEVLNMETGELTEAPDEADEIAEQMTPELPTEDEPEPEPDAEPDEPEPLPEPTGPTPEDAEQRFKKLEQSTGTYARRVGELLDWMADDLAPCLLCSSTPHLGFLNVRAAGTVPPEIVKAVQRYLGFETEIDYRPDGETRRCPRCDGEGKVSTGSKVKTAMTMVCRDCRGFGCMPPPLDDPTVSAAVVASPVPITENVAPLNAEPTDPTGEPRILPDGRENPNYGKWPQMKVLVPPYGVTAGLTAQSA